VPETFSQGYVVLGVDAGFPVIVGDAIAIAGWLHLTRRPGADAQLKKGDQS
jgi:hypothetical protein